MRKLFLIVFLVFQFCSPSRAQFKIEEIIDRNPLNLGVGAELRLSRFGDKVVATASTFAAIRGAQAIINAFIPVLNRQIGCAKGRSFGGEISELRPVTGSGTEPLLFEAVASVSECRLGAVSGTVGVAIPVLIDQATMRLKAGPPRVDSRGVFLVGWFRVPDRLVSKTSIELAPRIAQGVNSINALIGKQLKNPYLQQQIKLYQLQAQSVQFRFDGNDLVANIVWSGQIPLSKVNGWIAQ